MTTTFEMSVITAGGIEDLARVANVLALHGLTLVRLEAETSGPSGLRFALTLAGDAPTCERCAQRMRTLVCVRRVEFRAAQQNLARV